MKIAVFGGSFNPIHKSHIEIIEELDNEFNFDKIIIVPNYNPKYKETLIGSSDLDRLNMVKLAIESSYLSSKCELFDTDIVNQNSYTYITLGKLKEIFPNDKLYFLMGSDSLKYFSEWVKPDIISSLADIICILRDEDKLEDMIKLSQELEEKFAGHFIVSASRPSPISSTKIRDIIKADDKEIITKLLDENVYKYILEHNLYK